MQLNIGTVLLTILNLLWPGAGLLWRRQIPQCVGYALSFGILNGFRHDIGAMWAFYAWALAQIHFYKVRNPARFGALTRAAKVVIGLSAIAALVLYSIMYGASWTNAGAIKMPTMLFVLVVVSLLLPAAIVTLWLAPRTAGDS